MLRGDQTVLQENFYRALPCYLLWPELLATQMLTRDLLALADFVV